MESPPWKPKSKDLFDKDYREEKGATREQLTNATPQASKGGPLEVEISLAGLTEILTKTSFRLIEGQNLKAKTYLSKTTEKKRKPPGSSSRTQRHKLPKGGPLEVEISPAGLTEILTKTSFRLAEGHNLEILGV